MIRTVILTLLISSFAAPAFARGGGSDIQHERREQHAEKEKQAGKKSPSLFDFFFGSDKKSAEKSK